MLAQIRKTRKRVRTATTTKLLETIPETISNLIGSFFGLSTHHWYFSKAEQLKTYDIITCSAGSTLYALVDKVIGVRVVIVGRPIRGVIVRGAIVVRRRVVV